MAFTITENMIADEHGAVAHKRDGSLALWEVVTRLATMSEHDANFARIMAETVLMAHGWEWTIDETAHGKISEVVESAIAEFSGWVPAAR